MFRTTDTWRIFVPPAILVNMTKLYGESGRPYRDIKLIKFCKKCGVEYRPARYTFFAMLGLCWKCRRLYYRKWYLESWKPWFAAQPKEKQDQIRKAKLVNLKVWVMKNKIKRRKQALESYHRNKHKHKRKHRATGRIS